MDNDSAHSEVTTTSRSFHGLINNLNHPSVCALIVLAVFAVFLFGRLHQSGFDPSAFVVAGDSYCAPESVPQNLAVLKASEGFDGQFYYRLALNPFTSQRTEFGITLDSPALRHQRVLYPFLAWLFSGNNPALVPAAMISINFIALCLIGWVAGAFAQTLKQHALWGLLIPFYPGFLMTFSRDTVEIVEVAMLLLSLLLLRRKKAVAATVFLVLAILTKETAFLIVISAGIVFLFNFWRSREKTITWYYVVVPMLTFLLLQLSLYKVWGEFPLLASGNSNLTAPFAGPVGEIMNVILIQRPFQLRKFAELMFLSGFTLTVVVYLRSSRATVHEKLLWILSTTLVISLSSNVWTEDWTFLRACSYLYTVGAIIILGCAWKVRVGVLSCSLVFWLLLFIKLLRSYSL